MLFANKASVWLTTYTSSKTFYSINFYKQEQVYRRVYFYIFRVLFWPYKDALSRMTCEKSHKPSKKAKKQNIEYIKVIDMADFILV